MKVRNTCLWTNGIHGEIQDIDGVSKDIQVTSSMVYCRSSHKLTEECKLYLRDKYNAFWDIQESAI
jgi:hypothetical protein